MSATAPAALGARAGGGPVYLFHEAQMAALCGQHCLNNLLQGSYFSAAGLAATASDLDAEERRLRGGGVGSPGVESANVDDSGNFSVTVLRRALGQGFGLDMQRVSSGSAVLRNCSSATAFIANYESHWFALSRHTLDPERRWFNFDSTFKRPQHVGNFYLDAFIGQLLQQGYSLFVVTGAFPAPMRPSSAAAIHAANSCWHLLATVLHPPPNQKKKKRKAPKGHAADGADDEEAMMLQFALQESLLASGDDGPARPARGSGGSGGRSVAAGDDEAAARELDLALQMSLMDSDNNGSGDTDSNNNITNAGTAGHDADDDYDGNDDDDDYDDEAEAQRQLDLALRQSLLDDSGDFSSGGGGCGPVPAQDEARQLELALQMSMADSGGAGSGAGAGAVPAGVAAPPPSPAVVAAGAAARDVVDLTL